MNNFLGITHDINNQLFILYSKIYKNKNSLGAEFKSIEMLIEFIAKRVRSLEFVCLDSGYIDSKTKEVLISLLKKDTIRVINSYLVVYPFVQLEYEKINCSDQFVMHNPLLLEQVIINIFDNSRKANATKCIVKVESSNNCLLIMFTDNGRNYTKKNNRVSEYGGREIFNNFESKLNAKVKMEKLDKGFRTSIYLFYQ